MKKINTQVETEVMINEDYLDIVQKNWQGEEMIISISKSNVPLFLAAIEELMANKEG